VLDLPIVPGTTLPEPGGLSYRDLRQALDAVARRGRVMGFDIVELDPPHDPRPPPRGSPPDRPPPEFHLRGTRLTATTASGFAMARHPR